MLFHPSKVLWNFSQFYSKPCQHTVLWVVISCPSNLPKLALKALIHFCRKYLFDLSSREGNLFFILVKAAAVAKFPDLWLLQDCGSENLKRWSAMPTKFVSRERKKKNRFVLTSCPFVFLTSRWLWVTNSREDTLLY